MQNSYTHNQRILAHRILKLLTGLALIKSEHGQKDKNLYMSKDYFAWPIVNIGAAIQDKTYEEIHNTCLLLVREGYVTIKENSLDIFKSTVEVIVPNGIDAYKSEYYLKLNKKDKNDRVINWPQKYWWLILLLSAIIFPLGTGLILDKQKKETIQEQPKIQLVHDTVYVYDNRNLKDTSIKIGK